MDYLSRTATKRWQVDLVVSVVAVLCGIFGYTVKDAFRKDKIEYPISLYTQAPENQLKKEQIVVINLNVVRCDHAAPSDANTLANTNPNFDVEGEYFEYSNVENSDDNYELNESQKETPRTAQHSDCALSELQQRLDKLSGSEPQHSDRSFAELQQRLDKLSGISTK